MSEVAAMGRVEAAAAVGPTGRVLVLDDDALFGRAVAGALEDLGFSPVFETDAARALMRVQSGAFAVALVDLVLDGDMTGGEAIERIRAFSPDTQIVVLTGHPDLGSAVDGLRHGVTDYLSKGDLDPQRLGTAVAGAARRHHLLRDNAVLLARLEESNVLLSALQDVDEALVGECHLDRVLARLVSAGRSLTGAEAGRALLLEELPGQRFVVHAASGDGAGDLVGARFPSGRGVSVLAAQGNGPVVVAVPYDHPAYDARVDGFDVHRPGLLSVPLRHGRVLGSLTVAGPRGGSRFGSIQSDLLARLARLAAVAVDNAVARERASNFFVHTSEVLVSLLEAREDRRPGHCRSVAALTDMVTRRLGLTDAERRAAHFAALLHDIGEVDLEAQTKGRKVPTSVEKSLREGHPAAGAELLRPIAAWEEILHIIHSHHERWDGRGYPRCLAGDEIPLGGRVVAVADRFDRLVNGSRGTGKMTADDALAVIEASAGVEFDPRVARLFVAEYRRLGHHPLQG